MSHLSAAQSFTVGPVQASEQDELAALLQTALMLPPLERMQRWIAALGLQTFRAIRRQETMIGALGLIQMGQWFGGARVPVAGVTAVGIAPQHRGSGVGTALVHAALHELHAAGVPLSALYPATLPIYHQAGYARAGQRITYDLPLAAIQLDPVVAGDEADWRALALEPLPLPPASEGGQTAPPDVLAQLYTVRARRTAGNLDRHPALWQRIFAPLDLPSDLATGQGPFCYLATDGATPQGYVIFTQAGRDEALRVQDMCVLTPQAGRRLLAFFASHRTMGKNVVWSGGLHDPLTHLLREALYAHRPVAEMAGWIDWMLRIVDVPGALRARGYPPGLRAELHLAVRDDLLPANNGRFVLHVHAGQAEVEPGGQGQINLGVRELAALYSGFLTPAELQAIGAIAGPAPDLALAAAVFAGPRPWLADVF